MAAFPTTFSKAAKPLPARLPRRASVRITKAPLRRGQAAIHQTFPSAVALLKAFATVRLPGECHGLTPAAATLKKANEEGGDVGATDLLAADTSGCVGEPVAYRLGVG